MNIEISNDGKLVARIKENGEYYDISISKEFIESDAVKSLLKKLREAKKD